MHLFRETLLLFSLNLLDALLTIVWVRTGVATEGNQLMAPLLESGDLVFLSAKVAIGVIAAIVLLRWGNIPVAKYGVGFALVIYIGLMGIHAVTGLSAFGYLPQSSIESITSFGATMFALVV